MKHTLYRTFSFVYGYSVSLSSIGLAHFNSSVNTTALIWPTPNIFRANSWYDNHWVLWKPLDQIVSVVSEVGKHGAETLLRPDNGLKCAANDRVKWGRMCWCFYPLYVSPGCSLIKMMMSRELPVLITFYTHFRLTCFWSHLKLNIYLSQLCPHHPPRSGERWWCVGEEKNIFICQLLIINLAKTPCRICEEVLI